MNISIISGSPRKESNTQRIATLLHTQLQQTETISSSVIQLNQLILPQFEKVWQTADDAPALFKPTVDSMNNSDAFIFVSPEYNGGYSPALKNFIDHFPKKTFYRKPIGIAVGSNGAFGGIRCTLQMQQLVPALFGILAPQMLIVPLVDKKIDEKGTSTDEITLKGASKFLEEFIWIANKLK